jgi:ArsR family transcriptional regulator
MVLRDAGLVQDRREGLNIFYRVTRPEVFAVIEAASFAIYRRRGQPARAPWPARLDNCPCPHCAPVAQPAAC